MQISGDTSEFIDAELQRLQGRIREVEAATAQVKNDNPGRLPEDMAYNQRLLENAVTQPENGPARPGRSGKRRGLLPPAVTAGLDNLQQLRRRQPGASAGAAPAPARGVSFEGLHGQAPRRHRDPARDRARSRNRISSEDADREAPRTLPQQQAEAEMRRAAAAGAGSPAGHRAAPGPDGRLRGTHRRHAARRRAARRAEARVPESLSHSVEEYSNKRLEASTAANMERRQKGEQFRVLESAVPPPEAVVAEPRGDRAHRACCSGWRSAAASRSCSRVPDSSFHSPASSSSDSGSRCSRRSRSSCSTPTARRRGATFPHGAGHGCAGAGGPGGLRRRIRLRERAPGHPRGATKLPAARRPGAAGRPRTTHGRRRRLRREGLRPRCTAHYGLLRSPFEMTPDPAFLYLGEAHREGLATLVYGVRVAEGVRAPHGRGGDRARPTLLHALLLAARLEHDARPSSSTHGSSRSTSSAILFDEYGIEERCSTKAEYLLRAEPLPDRTAREGAADAPHRGRGAEPLDGDARGDPPALEPRDADLEADPDHAGRAARAVSEMLARPGPAAAPPAHRAAPPPRGPSTRRRRRLRRRSGCDSRATRAPASSTAGPARDLHEVTGGIPRLLNIVCDGACCSAST